MQVLRGAQHGAGGLKQVKHFMGGEGVGEGG